MPIPSPERETGERLFCHCIVEEGLETRDEVHSTSHRHRLIESHEGVQNEPGPPLGGRYDGRHSTLPQEAMSSSTAVEASEHDSHRFCWSSLPMPDARDARLLLLTVSR